MSLPVAFRWAARAEFVEAAARYEAQKVGLGAQFIAAIERAVAQAAEQPQLYAVHTGDIRRVHAERFPYSVYFRSERSRIVVLAVFHSSRAPAIWQRRT